MLVRTLNRHDKLNLLHFKENVSISPLRMSFAVFFSPPIDIHYPGKEAPFYSWSTEVFIFKIIVLIGPFQHLWAQESKTIVCCFYWWEFQCVFLKFQSSHSLKKKHQNSPVLFLAIHFVVILMACIHNKSVPLNWERWKWDWKRNKKGFTGFEIV